MAGVLPEAWGDDQAKAVEAVVKRRGPALVVAASMGEKEVKNARQGVSLKARFQAMKEDIVREATMRMLRLHEQEEIWALKTCLRHLGDGPEPPSAAAVMSCREVLAERLRVVQRRLDEDAEPEGKPLAKGEVEPAVASEAKTAASDGSKGEVEAATASSVKVSVAVSPEMPLKAATNPLLTPEYWSEISGLAVSTKAAALEESLAQPLWDTGGSSVPVAVEASAWGTRLASSGWTSTPVLGEAFATAAAELHAAARRLRERAGWPPAFVFMTDEAWRVMAQLQRAINELMRPVSGEQWAWRLEPSFAAFLLAGGEGRRLGDSFPLPHRDHSYGASFDSEGKPKLISVWVPLTDVTIDSGCMYVVPREFDTSFASDGAYEHMQVLSEATWAVQSELKEGAAATRPEALRTTAICGFPLAGARPLPCARGSVLTWNANLIHWGSFCHATATEPRSSLALVFRRVAAPGGVAGTAQLVDPEAEPLDLESASCRASLASVGRRLRYVLGALAYFEHWYDAGDVKRRVQEALRTGAGTTGVGAGGGAGVASASAAGAATN
eukprot:TRINITY_DN30406_c0_g3_i1.p1 TRINITY_DN30406_c0_g3~~TRINITY_DN30406_c0_g3_i1.p1  ORF type:complete len:556 (-),score=117.04 TRINITY_DN30406_c0_g3_i1:120-1787(-)